MKVKEAIILGGGLARRMGNNRHAKWFTPLGNTKMTIAEYQLAWLKKNGIEDIYVTLNSRYANLSTSIFPEHPNLKIIWEPEPIGDEGGLKNALRYLEELQGVSYYRCLAKEHAIEDVLVVNGDILTDLEISSLVPSTMVAVHPRSPWGVLRKQYDYELIEKPLLSEIWINAGIYLLPKSIKEELLDVGEMARHILPMLLLQKRLDVYHYLGYWHAVETIKDAENLPEIWPTDVKGYYLH